MLSHDINSMVRYVINKKYTNPCFFFFQAEDGIRDLVRSRGLGDVYKRQALFYEPRPQRIQNNPKREIHSGFAPTHSRATIATVSYTHLTLPTSDLV